MERSVPYLCLAKQTFPDITLLIRTSRSRSGILIKKAGHPGMAYRIWRL